MADIRLFIDNGKATLITDGFNTVLTLEETNVLIEGLTKVHLAIEARQALEESYQEVPEEPTAQIIHVDPERWGRG